MIKKYKIFENNLILNDIISILNKSNNNNIVIDSIIGGEVIYLDDREMFLIYELFKDNNIWKYKGVKINDDELLDLIETEEFNINNNNKVSGKIEDLSKSELNHLYKGLLKLNLLEIKESMSHKKSIDQMKRISDIMGKSNIGTRVSDSSFANALGGTKKNIYTTHIQSYDEYMKEPFTVNQNRMPWEKRKKSKSKKLNENNQSFKNKILDKITKDYYKKKKEIDNLLTKLNKDYKEKYISLITDIMKSYFDVTEQSGVDLTEISFEDVIVIKDYVISIIYIDNMNNLSIFGGYLSKEGEFNKYLYNFKLDEIVELLENIFEIDEIISTYSSKYIKKLND